MHFISFWVLVFSSYEDISLAEEHFQTGAKKQSQQCESYKASS